MSTPAGPGTRATAAVVAAVDLGASSGRVLLCRVSGGGVRAHEVHRFPNRPVRVGGTLHWDVLALYAGVVDGVRAAAREAGSAREVLAAVGVDGWAVDYGLLAADGALLGNPVHHRDGRTAGVPERVDAIVPPAELYAATGIQRLPVNTLYQLVSAAGTPALGAARTLLLVPDLLVWWLTGEVGAEATNASTTQLLDVRTRAWATGIAERLGVPAGILPPLRHPGDIVGPVLPDVAAEHGLPAGLPVVTVGSHDTASAVVGVPAAGHRFAYVSSGTWSLVGLELDDPVLTEAARSAGFTNEGGVDGTVRFLRNVTGLWLLQECVRTWSAAGLPSDLATLLADAARVPRFTALVDADDPAFLPPGNMPERIAAACAATGQTPPQSQAETVRCVLDSLAVAYRRTLRRAQELSGREAEVVHVVGGGARNALLCQLTADACGLPVLAGPVEAAALGNALVQARALGVPVPDLVGMRQLLRRSHHPDRYDPTGDRAGWAAAEQRVHPRVPA